MSQEVYKGFKGRYVNDMETPGAIRVYVEQKPPQFAGRTSESLRLKPARGGAPEYLDFAEKPVLFLKAQEQFHAWVEEVLAAPVPQPAPVPPVQPLKALDCHVAEAGLNNNN